MKKFTRIVALLAVAALMLCVFTGCDKEKTPAPSSANPAASSASNSDLEYIKNKGKMVIGITDYAPMNYQEKGEWTGFDTEFAEKICEKIGVKAEFFVLADWGAKVNELNAKTIDAVWNGMTITDDLKEGMDISDPYVVNAQVIVCKKANTAKYATAESIKDAKIAVESGSAAEELVKDYKNVTASQNMANALLEVQSGAADVAVIDITMANAMTGEGTSYADLAYTASLSEEEYGIGVRKGSDLCAKINELMAEMKKDGSLKELADKYKLTLAD